MTAARTVVIADAEPAMRMGVRIALERGGFEVRDEAGDADAAVDATLRERPDVCLIDVTLPGGGIDAARAVSRRLPATRIVMLSASADDRYLFAAIAAGANGYLLKDTDPQRLPLALEGVIDGEAALPRALVLRLIERLRALDAPDAADAAGREELTEREAAVLDLLRRGRETADIAELLGISPVTVRRHVSQVVRKLGVADREAAVRLARGGEIT